MSKSRVFFTQQETCSLEFTLHRVWIKPDFNKVNGYAFIPDRRIRGENHPSLTSNEKLGNRQLPLAGYVKWVDRRWVCFIVTETINCECAIQTQ